jgi:hypothetical protein
MINRGYPALVVEFIHSRSTKGPATGRAKATLKKMHAQGSNFIIRIFRPTNKQQLLLTHSLSDRRKQAGNCRNLVRLDLKRGRVDPEVSMKRVTWSTSETTWHRLQRTIRPPDAFRRCNKDNKGLKPTLEKYCTVWKSMTTLPAPVRSRAAWNSRFMSSATESPRISGKVKDRSRTVSLVTGVAGAGGMGFQGVKQVGATKTPFGVYLLPSVFTNPRQLFPETFGEGPIPPGQMRLTAVRLPL